MKTYDDGQFATRTKPQDDSTTKLFFDIFNYAGSLLAYVLENIRLLFELSGVVHS